MYPIHKYNLCRLCLFVGDQLMNIFDENDSIDFVAHEAIEDLLQFKVVEEAGFPWLVCSSCLTKLTEFRLFKRRCIECKFTFEERYLNAEESHAVEIKPEELQINDEEEENPDGRGADEGRGGEDDSRMEGEDGSEEYARGDDEADHSLLDCEQTPEDFVKAEIGGEGGDEEEGEEALMDGSFTAGDVVEVKVEELNAEDGLSDARVEAEGIAYSGGESEEKRGVLLAVGEEGSFAQEELMCAVCEDTFADMRSLRGHLPCSSASSGVTLAAAVGNSEFSQQWEHNNSIGLDHTENYVKTEASFSHVEGVTSGETTQLRGGHSIRRGGNRFAYRRGGVARGGRGGRVAMVARNAARGPSMMRPRLSGNFTIDKKVSFQCDMCRHGFSRLDLLKKHIQSHSEEGGYACPVCKKSFRTRWSLKNHRKSHQKVSQYECPICGRKFSRPQHLEAHRATHGTGTEYQCGICRKTFPQSSYLEMHLRTTHSGEESTQCHICGKRFSNKNVLKVHLRVHMDIKPFRCELCDRRFAHKPELRQHQLYPCEADPNPQVAARLGPYQCRLCGEGFQDGASLTQHMEKHPQEVKPDPDQPPHPTTVPNDPDIVPLPKIGPGGVLRESLNTGISYEEEVRVKRSPRHADSDSEVEMKVNLDHEADFVPGLASDESSDPTYRPPEGSSAVERQDSSGTKVRPHRCQICHKCFGEKWELNSHHRVHTQSNPHECSICGKRFTETVNLRKHMLVHADSRPFDCPFCAKPFTLRKNLKRHLELESCLKRLDFNTSDLRSGNSGVAQQHEGGGVAAGSSGGAERGFGEAGAGAGEKGESDSKTLDDIMAAAKEASVEVYLEQEGSVSRVFPCTFCEKTFLRTDQLKKHLMVHGGIKPHACTLCSRRFTEKGNLSKHMKTHAYEKPYPCKFCEKAYTQKKNLERHLLTHQSDEESAG